MFQPFYPGTSLGEGKQQGTLYYLQRQPATGCRWNLSPDAWSPLVTAKTSHCANFLRAFFSFSFYPVIHGATESVLQWGLYSFPTTSTVVDVWSLPSLSAAASSVYLFFFISNAASITASQGVPHTWWCWHIDLIWWHCPIHLSPLKDHKVFLLIFGGFGPHLGCSSKSKPSPSCLIPTISWCFSRLMACSIICTASYICPVQTSALVSGSWRIGWRIVLENPLSCPSNVYCGANISI